MLTPDLLTRTVFLDFEASSLAPDSWPIEIGLSWLDGQGDVHTWDSLIRPAPDWPEAAWSAQSAEVHGIPAADLAMAPPAPDVAAAALGRMRERVIVADSPSHDTAWLIRLLSTLPPDTITWPAVDDYDALTAGLFPAHALDWVYERLERTHAPHRAGPDSARLARGWAEGARRAGWIEAP